MIRRALWLRIARAAHDIAVYASGRAADYALDEALAKWVKRTEREPLAEALRREAESSAPRCTPERCTIVAFHSPCQFQTARYARGALRNRPLKAVK